MPATTLDARTALVTIDLQKGLAAFPTLRPLAAIAAEAGRLAEAFRRANLPVFLVNIAFSEGGVDRFVGRTEVPPRSLTTPDFGDLLPELGARPGDLRITKRQPNAFFGTELDLQLRRRGVTGIVIAGVAASIGVDSTARAAHERAYNVTYAADAITDVDAEALDVMLKKLYPRFGEIDTVDALVKLLPR